MRLERDEAGRRILVAFPARRQPVGRIDRRRRVANELNGMIAVAVVAFCSKRVAERADLGVVGAQLALHLGPMAGAALLNDGEFHRTGRRRPDSVRAVAVAADRGVHVDPAHDQTAVNGI